MFESLFRAAGSTSLMGGWIPATVQVLTVLVLIRAAWRRSRHWRLMVLPVAATFGVLVAAAARWCLTTLGMASEPAPWRLWLWTALSGLAVGFLAGGWPGDRWSRRNLCAFGASLCLLSTGLTVNAWIGYFPTVYTAWNQLTAGPLPDETDWATVSAMQRRGTPPDRGAVLKVEFNADVSGFAHREELVYLPPAWFASRRRAPLPAVMMIGGQFNTPADWVRAGDAVSTLDAFATAHGGMAPVAVFVDPSGAFTNDTECVNGPRGNAADHLINDVVPQVIAKFGVSSDVRDWGVVGFSSGGTCAIDLTVMHPDVFGSFIDIAGDLGPNAGTKPQTIDRLFGGDAEAWSAFDPGTVIARHGRYLGVAGLFVVPRADAAGTADGLCTLGRANGIQCAVVRLPGRHVWPLGGAAFAATLPWLAERLCAPGLPVATAP